MSDATPSEATPPIGTRLGRYVVLSTLGMGAMGVVVAAYDPDLDRKAALKLMRPRGTRTSVAQARLAREAQALAKLNHPNVVTIYDVGMHQGQVFVAMEFVAGTTLREWMATPRRWQDVVRVFAAAGRGLAAAHEVGLVHRDFKPDNVMIDDAERVRVMDFGLARAFDESTLDGAEPKSDVDAARMQLDAELDSSSSRVTPLHEPLTRTGTLLGTPAYMAPEQIRGNKVDGRADQFAWAVTAYELFVGKPPFTGDPMAVIAAILTEEPVPPPPAAKMPLAFASVLRRALSKRAEDRYPSMHAVVEAIEAAREPAPAAAPAPPPPRPASMPPGSMSPGSMPPVSPHVSYPMPYSQGPMLTRRYAPLEVAALFDRALAAQPRRYGYDDVARAANEVGVDAATAQQAMNQLALRGTVEQSPREKEADMMRVRRLLGIFGVLASFFLLLNLSDLHDIWFQYPVICLAVPFGLMIVTTIFRSPKKVGLVHGDAMFEHDVARLTEYLRVRPEAHPASLAPPQLRIATPSAPPAPAQSETMRQAEAEVEAFLASSPSRADRAQGK